MRREDAFQAKYLKGSDLDGRTVIVTIERMAVEEVEDGKTRPILYFVGKDKGMVMNPTNWDLMELYTGQEESNSWIGATILIWHDPTVMYKGKRTGGMRIKGLAPGQQHEQPPPPSEPPPPIAGDDIPF